MRETDEPFFLWLTNKQVFIIEMYCLDHLCRSIILLGSISSPEAAFNDPEGVNLP